jgi:hypothetical protein
VSIYDLSKPRPTREDHYRNAIRRLQKRVSELEASLRRAADEPNIDQARAIADAALEEKHE